VAPGCSNSTTPAPIAQVDAAYGGPPVDSGPAPAYGGPPVDGGPGPIVDAAYGGPPIFDAADAGGGDAAEDAPAIVDAAYGGPPLDSGND
jgi:hypothetical protein